MEIRKIIKEKGMTVQEVADKMGITQSSLNQTISGNPSVKKLESIAEAIGCKVGDFFETSTPPHEEGFRCPFWAANLEIKEKK